MPARRPRPKPSGSAKAAGASGGSGRPEDLRLRLQLLAAFLVPLLAVGLWLQSKGFFSQG